MTATAEEITSRERMAFRLRRLMGLIEQDGRGVARVAAAAGLSEGQLKRRMRDISKIGIAELVMLCETLGVDAGTFLTEPPSWEDDWFADDGLHMRASRFGSVLVTEARGAMKDGRPGFRVSITVDGEHLTDPETVVADAKTLAKDLSDAVALAEQAIAAATLDDGLTLDPSL